MELQIIPALHIADITFCGCCGKEVEAYSRAVRIILPGPMSRIDERTIILHPHCTLPFANSILTQFEKVTGGS